MQEGNSSGVLLLHGFGDTPQTLDLLARHLYSAGFDVRVPLLPGHGTSVAEFLVSRREDWIALARAELGKMQRSHSSVALVGLSMGGALAAILAAETPQLKSLVLLAPYLDMPKTHKVAAATHWLWDRRGVARASTSPRSILDPVERKKNLGYGVYSARLLYELWRVSTQARRGLGKIRIPTMLIQSRSDPRISPSVAERAFSAIAAPEKKLRWAEGGGHIITVDYGRDEVFADVTDWIVEHQS